VSWIHQACSKSTDKLMVIEEQIRVIVHWFLSHPPIPQSSPNLSLSKPLDAFYVIVVSSTLHVICVIKQISKIRIPTGETLQRWYTTGFYSDCL